MTASPDGTFRPLVEQQIEAAQRDPRLEHSREAVIADWIAAMEAAERARTLADWGLYEVERSEEIERMRIAAQGGCGQPADVASRMAAARERAALAKAERVNQMAELNAMTLVTMVGALDAMVEELAPRAQQMRVEAHVNAAMGRVAEEQPDAFAAVDAHMREALGAALQSALAKRLPAVERLRGAGAARWEDVLHAAGLQTRVDRPIPHDLDLALAEIVALRHVIAHRASRVDERALKQAPSLLYTDGDLIRLDRTAYRRYSAALRAYGTDVISRATLGMAPRPELSEWMAYVTVNA